MKKKKMDLSVIVTKSYGWMIIWQYHGIYSERMCRCFPFVFQFVSKCMISMVLGI